MNNFAVQDRYGPVRIWLWLVVLILFLLVLVGGATRLTDSGLSITEWKPILGVVPPFNDTGWSEAFEKYKQIPEYQQINRDMSLSEFRTIYWWEWGHRFLARFVGLAFALPLIWFWWTGYLSRGLKAKLLAILALGGLQGAIGWWMVASGLTERTDVSQYRLAVHLILASIIVAAIVSVATGLIHRTTPGSRKNYGAGLIVLICLVQIYLGGLVAGLDAGLAYNSWPLMDGALVPSQLWVQEPWWRNLFENAKTVQFVHRIGAYVLLLTSILHFFAIMAIGQGHGRWNAAVLLTLVVLQALLGIVTLIKVVPFELALAHQGLALIVLIFSVRHWRLLKL